MGIFSRFHEGVKGEGGKLPHLDLLGHGKTVHGAGVVADAMPDCGHGAKPFSAGESIRGASVGVLHGGHDAHASVSKRTNESKGKSRKRRGWRDLCGISQDPGNSHEHLFGRLTARFIRRRFPQKPAEHVAVILNNSAGQCHDLLVGRSKWTLRHALLLLKHFGTSFLHAVIHPVTGAGGGNIRLRFRRRSLEASA